MAYSHYERLTALDLSFLEYEAMDPAVHMHVGAVALFQPGPLATEDGGIDIHRIRAGIEASLAESPRFRQKLAHVPLIESPVWVDAERFNLNYHVRHTALPKPGTLRQLKRLVARITSQKLDRSKPLWEFWFVEGLEDGRFALIAKAHHSMVDGMSGFDLLARIMRGDPDPTLEPAAQWIPRPVPSRAKLLADEAIRRVRLPFDLAGVGARAVSSPAASFEKLRDGSGALYEAFVANLVPATKTPLNPEIGPYRRFDWTRVELAAVKEVKQSLGGTVNDVVLACVSGAVRRFLIRRSIDVSKITFRAMVPVSVRLPDEQGVEGNRVVTLIAELPVGEPDPGKRLARVVETTKKLKGSRQAKGVEILEEIADRTYQGLFVSLARMTASQTTFNTVVTNVPGPPTPVWLLGAQMEEIYPLVPIFVGQALGTALFSYNGSVYWGFNADWDSMPDLHDVVEWIDEELEALRKLASHGG